MAFVDFTTYRERPNESQDDESSCKSQESLESQVRKAETSQSDSDDNDDRKLLEIRQKSAGGVACLISISGKSSFLR
jgi:hypothetical protein